MLCITQVLPRFTDTNPLAKYKESKISKIMEIIGSIGTVQLCHKI